MQYLTEKEVAPKLGIKIKTLQGWRYKKIKLPYYKKGRNVYYELQDIEAYMEAGRIPVDRGTP